MNQFITAIVTIFIVLSGLGYSKVYSSQQEQLLPESLSGRNEMSASQRNYTIFLKEDDPEKAAQLLNTANDEYTRQGWSVFSIVPYIEGNDFEGFFVTYQKNLVIN